MAGDGCRLEAKFAIGQGGFADTQVICKDLAILAELIREKLSSILP